MRFATLGVGLFALTLCAALPAAAQTTPMWPVGEFKPYALDSGTHANRGVDYPVVFEETVHVDDAAWIRLYFGEVNLGKGSVIRVTSLFDGEVQELDFDTVIMWNYSTAYFNGDSVLVELVAGPNTSNNRMTLAQIATQIMDPTRGPCADDDCGICGADNRTPSNVQWSGRMMPVGCTGSVYNTSSCVVSAGHCVDGGYADVIQFNVPDSSSNCWTYNPSVADQFPITNYSYNNNGPGDDWAVMTVGTNSYGERPYDRYGVYRPISDSVGNSGQPVAVWGYGVDNDNPTRSQTQQTHAASIYSRSSDRYNITVDITYGNSGSGVILYDEIIGIVSHCPCPATATRVDNSDFAAARDQLCPGGGGGGYCSAWSESDNYEYISNVSVGSINNSSGASEYSDYTGQSTEMVPGESYNFSLTIGNPYSSDIGGLWIDWNGDEDFLDSNETIPTNWSGNGPYTTTINVPTGLESITTRMRVRIQDENYDENLSSCGATSYGEVEDYTIEIAGCTNPAVPTGVTASSFTYCDYVRVNWNQVSGATSYKVYRNTVNSPSTATLIGSPTVPPLNDTYASPGIPYYYWVKAHNACGDSNFSGGAVGFRGEEPDVPTYVQASLAEYCDRVRVTWEEADGASGYKVYRGTNNNPQSSTLIGTPDDSPYNDTAAIPGVPYYYWVKSTSSCGDSDFNILPAQGLRATVPPAPGNVSASDGTYTDRVRVSWNAASTASSYQIWRHTSNQIGGAQFLGNDSSSPYDDYTASPGVTYYYWVRAANDCGTGEYSNSNSGYALQEVTYEPGDMNCDGVINNFDIDPFVMALTDPAGYEGSFPDCEYDLGDINGDGAVNNFDIDPFVELLTR